MRQLLAHPALAILFDTVKKSTDAEIRERSQALIIETNAKVPPLVVKQWVECVAISPNGKWLAAGGSDPDPRGAGVLRLWELPRLTGK